MHGRTRITIDPRYPYNAGDGARRVFTDQAGVGGGRKIALLSQDDPVLAAWRQELQIEIASWGRS